LGAVAQRGSPDLRARVPRETRLLMRRRLFRVLCVLGLLGVEAAAARADVAAYLGRTVGSVRLVLEGRETTDPMLTHIVLTAAGQPLSMVQVRETVAHLFSLGR